MWRRRVRAGAVVAVLVLLVPVSLAGGLGLAALMAALGIVTAILGTVSSGTRERPGEWFAALLLFALWAAVSSLWSQHPLPGGWAVLGATPVKILLGVVVFAVAAAAVVHTARRDRDVVGNLALAVFALLLGLTLVDLASGYGLSQFVDPAGEDLQLRLEDARKNVGRGVVVLLLLLPPTALAMRRTVGGTAGAAVAALLGVGVAAAGHWSGQWVVLPALAAGGAMGAVAWVWPRVGTYLAFGAAGLSLALAPVLGRLAQGVSANQRSALPFSAEHRLEMWSYATARISEAPVRGYGFGASRVFDATADIRGFDMPLLGLHPHNMGLQLWLETGAVGVALACAAVGTLAFSAVDWAGTDPERAFAVSAVAVAAAVVGALSFGVWQEWWWALVFLASAMLSVHLPERQA